MAGQANDGYEIAIRPRWNLEELQAI